MIFNSDHAKAILETRIPQGTEVTGCPGPSQMMESTIKTGYKYWHSQHIGYAGLYQLLGWGKIWRLNIPHKIIVFL